MHVFGIWSPLKVSVGKYWNKLDGESVHTFLQADFVAERNTWQKVHFWRQKQILLEWCLGKCQNMARDTREAKPPIWTGFHLSVSLTLHSRAYRNASKRVALRSYQGLPWKLPCPSVSLAVPTKYNALSLTLRCQAKCIPSTYISRNIFVENMFM
jgi:hypothetical protein